jgi:hypothetical protein
LGFGEGGGLRQPLDISIVGGLILSHFLNLCTTPVVYLYFDRLRLWMQRRWRRRHPDSRRRLRRRRSQRDSRSYNQCFDLAVTVHSGLFDAARRRYGHRTSLKPGSNRREAQVESFSAEQDLTPR